jgi:ubiquinone/menaquinone biosynthesis C-methylase UbiE
MNLKEATAFIRFENKNPSSQLWMELGCGDGLFTVALANNLPASSKIIAIDKDEKGLKKIPPTVNDVTIQTIAADFVSDTTDAEDIDGIVMANSLHYVKHKQTLLNRLVVSMKTDGVFVIVEYDRPAGNQWVPYPLTIGAAKALFKGLGYSDFQILNKRRSVFGRHYMYAAIVRPGSFA